MNRRALEYFSKRFPGGHSLAPNGSGPFDSPGELESFQRSFLDGTLVSSVYPIVPTHRFLSGNARGKLGRRQCFKGYSGRQSVSGDQQAAAREFKHQGGLGPPLALDQTGAFIEETQSSPIEYLRLYAETGAELRPFRAMVARDLTQAEA
jgi:hypothetical protein